MTVHLCSAELLFNRVKMTSPLWRLTGFSAMSYFAATVRYSEDAERDWLCVLGLLLPEEVSGYHLFPFDMKSPFSKSLPEKVGGSIPSNLLHMDKILRPPMLILNIMNLIFLPLQR